MLGADAESGVDFEPIEEIIRMVFRRWVMMLYGGWRYVKHNEQNINMCDKPTGDKRCT